MKKEELIDKIAELDKQIDDLQAQMDAIEEKKDELEDERSDLSNELSKIETEERTTSFLQKVANLNLVDALIVRLTNESTTLDLMDEFFYSKKSYLIFDRAFHIRLGDDYKCVSLIISKFVDGVDYTYSHYKSLTMTVLKSNIGGYISERLLCNEKSRMFPLYNELVKLGKREYNNETIVPFEMPCLLDAQIYNNRTGYGTEDGTLYGETTGFLIVGVLVNS